ncbi:hypothetical protein JOB18_022683 [Solea senegalensis]|uniref:MHC class I antigen n=1 Tax=Solea senegalensis TaxID=28829 RepID=A0AAV6RS04_SOLSE|nr:hypothetical protein JOB18_022683 [Solea senegalensis]
MSGLFQIGVYLHGICEDPRNFVVAESKDLNQIERRSWKQPVIRLTTFVSCWFDIHFTHESQVIDLKYFHTHTQGLSR